MLSEVIITRERDCQKFDVSRLVVPGEIVHERDLVARFEAVFETEFDFKDFWIIAKFLQRARVLGDLADKPNSREKGWQVLNNTNMATSMLQA